MTDPSLASLADMAVLDRGDLDGVALDVAGWRPSPRARRAEALAQLVLNDESVAAPLRLLVRKAALATGAENAQISIISTRQIAVVAERGAPGRLADEAPQTGVTTALEDTVCAVSVRADAPLCIPDTHSDDRVASLPAVRDGVVGAYLGSPLRTAEGSVIGVLCVYDARPHDWTSDDCSALDAIAALVADALAAFAPAEGGA